MGPKPSEENKREFTEEQLRAGDGIIGLQAGTNKGATQVEHFFENLSDMIKLFFFMCRPEAIWALQGKLSWGNKFSISNWIGREIANFC